MDSSAPPPSVADVSPARPTVPPWRLRLDEEQEYYAPTKPDRPIRSSFLNAVAGAEWTPGHLALLGGLTVTGAAGSILQYGDHFETVRLASRAVGAGPMFLVRWEFARPGPVAVSLDAVGALVLYDAHFPAGGDVYNFTWRAGLSAALRLSDRVSVRLGGRVLHVSNGQGFNQHNPSYEGAGGHAGVTLRL